MHVQLSDNKRNDMLNGRRKILRLYWRMAEEYTCNCPTMKE